MSCSFLLRISNCWFSSLWYRTESVEKPSPVEKKYEPVPQVTPALPPATLPKPAPEGTLFSQKERKSCQDFILYKTVVTSRCIGVLYHTVFCLITDFAWTHTRRRQLSDTLSVSSQLTLMSLPQPRLLPERTLSRPTSCLTRVSLRSLQLMAQVNNLRKHSQIPGLRQYPATTATRLSPTPRLPSLLLACSTVLNSTTTFCPMTNQRSLRR